MKMAISWTLIVLGTLLQGMQCNANDNSTAALNGTTLSTVVATTADSTKSTVPLTSLSSTKPTTSSASLESTTPVTTLTSLKPSTPSSSPESTTQAPTTKATSPAQTGPSSTVAYQANNTTSQNVLVTTQITTIQPTTPNAGTTLTTFNNSPQSSPTTLIATDPNQSTTNSNKPATTTFTKDGTTQLLSTQTSPSAVAKNSELPTTEPDSKSTASQSLGTTKAQTTTASIIPGQRIDEDITTNTPQKIFNYSFDLSNSTEKNVLVQTCKTLGQKMKGNCTVTVEIHDKRLIATVTIDADQKIPPDNYKPTEPASADNSTSEKQNVNEDTIPDTLIAILASCGALVLILCCFAAYCTYHRRSYRKNQQHLTEELQTVENGYHDNPTLEVMEVQPEMQEKKLTMNREFNDSWIVPIDNLLKEDIPDEEDTHL